MNRRNLLRAAAATASISLMVASGLVPRRVIAQWPTAAFEAKKLTDAEGFLFGHKGVEESELILIKAPDIAENGRNVPVEIETSLPGATSVSLFSDSNPFPLLARAHFTPLVEPRVAMRFKLGGSGNLTAVVEADGKLYRGTRAIKVTAGGCGG